MDTLSRCSSPCLDSIFAVLVNVAGAAALVSIFSGTFRRQSRQHLVLCRRGLQTSQEAVRTTPRQACALEYPKVFTAIGSSVLPTLPIRWDAGRSNAMISGVSVSIPKVLRIEQLCRLQRLLSTTIVP